MARSARRRKGGPHYPLDDVHTLAQLHSIQFTRKALDEGTALLPGWVALPPAAMRKTLLKLREEDWLFSQQNEHGWVDVYRIVAFNRLVWVKLKVEASATRELVILLSFHEFDESRSI
jgi:hypothetical protein